MNPKIVPKIYIIKIFQKTRICLLVDNLTKLKNIYTYTKCNQSASNRRGIELSFFLLIGGKLYLLSILHIATGITLFILKY